MFPIEDWSKERVHNVMLDLLYSFNYTWFLMEEWLRKNCPEKLAHEGLMWLTDEFGVYEAKRLEKTVDENSKGIDRLILFLEHSHWAAFEDVHITKLSDTRMRMATMNCTSQKAAGKWGMEYYDCGEIALRLRSAFLKQVNPKATVTPLFVPPEKAGEGRSSDTACEWIISIE